MDADRLFDAALDRRPHERTAFLREACAGDEELLRAVESLLENERDAGGFLETPALDLMAQRHDVQRAVSLIGRELAGYQIIDLVGIGGMGDVYRARDSKLGRDVAVKVLPHALTSDVDRFARLGREARILAALNHAHIASIYGLEEADSGPALILEFVDGPTLADRLQAGALPVAETLAIGRGIADALDAAHEKGIVHRDLKPANIKVRADGFVKVLDFGLAKAIVSDSSAADPLLGARPGAEDTQESVILGTAAYMSPEQARGERVDRRTDIWALGCILFEMLTGRPVFTGATASDTIASVLREEPDWRALPAETPSAIHHLLRRCLSKDRKGRISDASVARLDIEEALSALAQDAQVRRDDGRARRSGMSPRGMVVPAVALVAATIVALSVVLSPRDPSRSAGPLYFQETVTGRLAETGVFSISPNGRHLVYAAEGADGTMQLWIRTMDALEHKPLPGTEVHTIVPTPFWSPDSRFVAFNPPGAVKRVGLDGGTPQTVCEIPAVAVGGSWNRQGDILLGNAVGGLLRCRASGGPATIVTVPDPSQQERHLLPVFLADGRHFLYLRISRTKPEESGIYVGELGAASSRVGNRLITTGFGAAYVPADDLRSGLIVFSRDGVVFAQRFDEPRLELIGNPIRLADRVGSYLDWAFFSVSPTTLLYRAPKPDFQLTWFDRQGRELGHVGAPAAVSDLALSPSGDRALVAIHAPQGTTDQDLWLFDLSRTDAPRKMTFEPELERSVIWATNDRFLFSAGGGATGMYQQTVGGQRQLLFKTNGSGGPASVTADGRTLLYTMLSETGTGGDVWMRTPSADSATAKPFLQGQRDQGDAQLSPDNRWVAYVSNEAGPNEVFITEFRPDSAEGTASAGDNIRISQGGGFAPRWRRDGRELFYLRPDGSLMSIDFDTNGHFRQSTAKQLFKVPGVLPKWGVTGDGARFLFAVPISGSPPFHIVQDWRAILPK